GLLAGAGLGTTAPLKGPVSCCQKFEAGATMAYQETFKGGERACVLVKGDHDPPADLILTVYDSKEQVVAKDEDGGDLCAVIWYPPRDGKYVVKVQNRS